MSEKSGLIENGCGRATIVVIGRAMPNTEIFSCVTNVDGTIASHGGERCFGWMIVDQRWYRALNAHCVWRDGDGHLWDVTPQIERVDGELATLAWPGCRFEEDRELAFETKAPPNRYRCDHPKGSKALEVFAESEKALSEGNLERCRYLTHKANRLVAQAGIKAKWDVPTSMDWTDLVKTI